MKVVERFPCAVREIEHLWIPLSDGARLAARVWLPEGAEGTPVPALLEYLPYGKREGTRARDEPLHRYLAGHGYACLRVDVRGTGESEGVLDDEYSERELADGEELISWIASQPWCSGAVGMIGKSWGGFNALQLAARQPPALRAVVSVCASEDRYADDAHYMGGCLLVENAVWGSVLFSLAALPPDPALVGEGWRAQWRARLEAVRPFAATWLAHPRRDAYWRRASPGEDLARLRCPVLAVSGWADAYTNAVPRLVAGLGPPSRGLVGPWAHLYPHEGVPGPAIGFLQETLRWFDRWLREVETGVEAEPRYRAWLQEGVAPRPYHAERPGRWVAETDWPSPRIARRRLHLAPGRLVESPARDERLSVCSPQSTGAAGGAWCSFGGFGPADQRPDDERSLCFDSAPLPQRLEILGAPRATLELAADRPVALAALRLCDVAPDGASTRVSYGLRNLAHADGHGRAEPLLPGRRFRVSIELNHAGHAFAAGHRIRLALATACWPVAWPAPEPVTLHVFTGAGVLELPVRPSDPGDARLRPFADPEGGPPPRVLALSEAPLRRRAEQDPATGEHVRSSRSTENERGEPALARLEDIDLDVGHGFALALRIRDDDPLSARAEVEHVLRTRRGDWSIRVATRSALSATRDAFRLESSLDAHEGTTPILSRRWDDRIPRDLV